MKAKVKKSVRKIKSHVNKKSGQSVIHAKAKTVGEAIENVGKKMVANSYTQLGSVVEQVGKRIEGIGESDK